MKDFIPKGTGDSRYLKSVADFMTRYPTYADFAAALIAGTLPVDFNGINSAGVAQMGTPLNRQTLLSPDVQNVFGLDDNATPSDALLATLGKREVARFTTSGIWTCPEGVTEIDAYLVGGGGGGRSYTYNNSQWVEGGAGGYAKLYRKIEVISGNEYVIEVGAGGIGQASTSNADQAGGATSAFGFSVGGADIYLCGGNQGTKYKGRSGGYGLAPSGDGVFALFDGYDQINPYDGLPYGNSGGGGGRAGMSGGGFGVNVGGIGGTTSGGDGANGGGKGGTATGQGNSSLGPFAGGGGGGPGGGGGGAHGSGSKGGNGAAGIVIIYA